MVRTKKWEAIKYEIIQKLTCNKWSIRLEIKENSGITKINKVGPLENSKGVPVYLKGKA